jgi:hypothetical protein
MPWSQRWRGPAKIIWILRKGSVDLQHLYSEEIMKGWHTDRLQPYYLCT